MRRLAALVLSLAVLATACSDNDPTDPGNNTTTLANGTFSGTVNGSPYRPASVTVTSNSGLVVFAAADAAGRGFSFAVSTTQPGTFDVTASTGASAAWVEGTNTWAASPVAGSGTVTISTLTASHLVGSFNVILAGSSAGAAGTRVVVGSFDITF